MPLFEFDEGRLVPAQFGRTVENGLTDDILTSVREQVLEIVGRPLFPITWQDTAPVGSGMDGGAPRLTALDASGQVVSVEVFASLDSKTMIDSLSRLADTASLGWNDLASAYPGGIQNFRLGWAEFRDEMPPSPAPGPRLILVVGQIDAAVRPALDVLATSGVEVHEIAVRSMSNGRQFLDVEAVGPRLYGHNPNLLASTGQIPLLTGANQSVVEERGTSLGEEGTSVEERGTSAQAASQRVEKPQVTDPSRESTSGEVTPADESSAAAEPEPHAAQNEVEPQDARVKPEPQDGKVEPESHAAEDKPESHRRQENQVTQEHQTGGASSHIPTLERGARALAIIGQILTEDTTVVWRDQAEQTAVLTVDGQLRTDQWSTTDPNEAAAIVSGSSEYDGWAVWKLGDTSGPSLGEALDEINDQIRAEYETVGKPQRGRRARRG